MRLRWQVALLFEALCVNVARAYPSQAFFESISLASKSLTNNSEWDLSSGPPVNSTSNFIFGTVNSFLQHWSNTRYRNGHSIVPGVMPVGSLLYHGTFSNRIPDTPEWTATDPEHSYLFCRSFQNDSGCWQLTLVATRPLKVLYFDGSSAAKMNDGPMDSQDLVIWGEVKPDWAFREGERITRLCDWGKTYGIDGFLRMEMDFEVMLCDFHAGVKPVSFLNIIPAGSTKRRPGERPLHDSAAPEASNIAREASSTGLSFADDALEPPVDGPKIPTSFNSLEFHVMESGSWHNHFPGDPRFQLDYSRIITFYDHNLFPDLHTARLGQGRLQHRLDEISPSEVTTLYSQLDLVLKDWHGVPSGSGVDWKNIMRVITNRYAERLELLHYILNSASISYATFKEAYRHMKSMLAPYTLYSAVPPSNSSEYGDHAWASPVYELCSTTHTAYIESSELASELSYSEVVLAGAVKNVTREICRVVVGLWAEGTELGLSEPDDAIFHRDTTFSRRPDISAARLAEDWKVRVEKLMDWLDWSYWLRCQPACGHEEMCYLPTWPWFRRRPPPKQFDQFEDADGGERDHTLSEPDQGDWVDPKPRCVRRLEPLGGLGPQSDRI